MIKRLYAWFDNLLDRFLEHLFEQLSDEQQIEMILYARQKRIEYEKKELHK